MLRASYATKDGQPIKRFATASWVDKVYDPGIKGRGRIEQKAAYKYADKDGKPMYRRVRDIARLALQYDSCAALITGLEGMRKAFKVVELDNRFAQPTALGWMDVAALVEIDVGGVKHVAELQLQLSEFARARTIAHRHYHTLRTLLPEKLRIQPKDLDRVQAEILDALQMRATGQGWTSELAWLDARDNIIRNNGKMWMDDDRPGNLIDQHNVDGKAAAVVVHDHLPQKVNFM